MTYSAPNIIARLVTEYGWDAVVDALVQEIKHAPDRDLEAIEQLLDAVMADLVTGEFAGNCTLQ